MYKVDIDTFGLPIWQLDEITTSARSIKTDFPGNPFWDTLIDNLVNILNAITGNAMNMFGMNFVNKVVNNFSNLLLGSMEFPFMAKVIEKYCSYMIDMRMTHGASITNEHMDLFFWAQINSETNTESFLPEPQDQKFSPRFDSLSVMISERTLNTFLQSTT